MVSDYEQSEALRHYKEEILEFAGYLLQVLRDVRPGTTKIQFSSGNVTVTLEDADPYSKDTMQLASHPGRPPEEALKQYYGEDYAAIAPKRHAAGERDE